MGPVLGRLLSKTKMRAFAFVLLCVAAVQADGEADAYTIGQVAAGLTNGGVVTGVGYSGAGHLGYAGVGHLGYAGVGHLGYAGVAAPAVRGYSALGYGYAGHYGKREAEAEADS